MAEVTAKESVQLLLATVSDETGVSLETCEGPGKLVLEVLRTTVVPFWWVRVFPLREIN